MTAPSVNNAANRLNAAALLTVVSWKGAAVGSMFTTYAEFGKFSGSV